MLHHGTNVSDIVEQGKMGFRAEPKTKDIALKMQQAYNFYKENGFELYSKNAKAYIKNNFTWSIVTKQALEIYENIINSEERKREYS